MVKSMPFLSLILLHYGNLWGLFFLLTAAPKFMNDALGFDLGAAGILASLPHLSRFLAGFVFGFIGDKVRSHGWMSTTMMRKVFCIFCEFFFVRLRKLFVIFISFVCFLLINSACSSWDVIDLDDLCW